MIDILSGVYGIQALSLQKVPAGWSASAWRVHSGGGDWFLKVYDKRKPSAKCWIDRIDRYVPVTLWLHENTLLRENMTAPQLTKNGSYKWEDERFLYMVFPYIDGRTLGSTKLTKAQTREIARITARLHAYGAELPVPTDSLLETFDVSFSEELNGWLTKPQTSVLTKALAPYAGTIARAIASLQAAAASLRAAHLRYALCHTDIHGWNLMQSENLILIDWEGLKLAPVEADLFSFTETFFFEYAWEDFLSAYRSVHKDFQVHPEALRFYRLRRRLEDIHAFAAGIMLDSLKKEDVDRSLHYLSRECALLPRTF